MTTTTNDMNKTENNLPTTPPAARAAEIRENTRRVLFPERDPRAFDCGSYAITFGFCDSGERKRLFEALKRAWAWGRSCGIGKRGGTQGETAGRKETREASAECARAKKFTPVRRVRVWRDGEPVGEFESIRAASVALGMGYKRVCYMCSKGAPVGGVLVEKV